MCYPSVLEFFISNVDQDEFMDKSVIEVGSRYVNGSVREFIEKFGRPRRYLGIDSEYGKGVDEVLRAEDLVKRFGANSFDVVVSAELLEHVVDWRAVIQNMKTILKPGGHIFVTTRSKGFPLHDYPYDMWRYELKDVADIFSDFEILSLKEDNLEPGVFLQAKKPREWKPLDLSTISLYSVVLGAVTKEIPSPVGYPQEPNTLDAEISKRDAQIEALRQELQTIHQSVIWRLLQGLGSWLDRAFPDSSKRGELKKIVRQSIMLVQQDGFRGYIADVKVKLKRREFRIVDSPNLNTVARYAPQVISYGSAEYQLLKESLGRFSYHPKISIVMPVYNTPEFALIEAIESVKNQVYENWELCICDDGSKEVSIRRILNQAEESDPRIKVIFSDSNVGISGASNRALDLATGDFVGFLDHDDVLTLDALYYVIERLNIDRSLDFVYTDHDKITLDGRRIDPFFKPAWSPDLLLSMNYISHFAVIRTSIVDKVGRFRSDFDGSQDYDLFLRVVEVTSRISRIPHVLYSWRMIVGSSALSENAKPHAYNAAERALRDALRRRGIAGEVSRAGSYGLYRVSYEIKDLPLVSIIVPTHNNRHLLERCISSVRSTTAYRNFELIIVDHKSDELSTVEYLRSLDCRVVRYEGKFNFSSMCNRGASEARGEYLLFLNNDTEVIQPEWLTAMLEHAQRTDVGAVGAKLFFPGGIVQHAGIIIGFGGFAINYSGFAEGESYFGLADSIRDCSAVTAACMLIRKKYFDELNGFDSDLSRSWQDVDLCLRLVAKGRRVIYTPHAQLRHYEGGTRGRRDRTNDETRCRLLFREKHKLYIQQGDPYYNPNLSLSGAPYSFRGTLDNRSMEPELLHQSRSSLSLGIPEGIWGVTPPK